MTSTQVRRRFLFAVIVCSLASASVHGAAAAAAAGTPGRYSERLQQVEAARGAETRKREPAMGNGPPKYRQTNSHSSKVPLLGSRSSTSNSALAGPIAPRAPAHLKAMPGNSVLGGPHTAGLGMIGGPANGRSISKASLDGSALRRRY
jgi:hypothetical protein